MPNHFHLVVMPDKGEELSRLMQWLMTSHVRRYHRHRGSSGHVWQGRFKSFIVEKDEHLLGVLRYVEGNPIRAKLIDSADEWPWSSHNDRIHKSSSSLVDEVPIELPLDWGRYVGSPLAETELERLRQSANRQPPYGPPEWQIEITRELGLESTIRPLGRPKRTGHD